MPLRSTLTAAAFCLALATFLAVAPEACGQIQSPKASPSEEGPPPAALFTSAPPRPEDVAIYDADVRASARAADGLQGSLDGGWRLAGSHGRLLYRIEIADRGLGPPTLEGAWRDLRARGPGAHCGYLSSIARQGGELRIRFEEPGAKAPVEITMRASGVGWRGYLRRGGRTARVTLTRAGA